MRFTRNGMLRVLRLGIVDVLVTWALFGKVVRLENGSLVSSFRWLLFREVSLSSVVSLSFR